MRDIIIHVINRFGDSKMLNSGTRPKRGGKVLNARQRHLLFVPRTFPLSHRLHWILNLRRNAFCSEEACSLWWALWKHQSTFHQILFSSSFLSPSENDLMFHFFGVESDSMRVREAINKMVEKGRIGNFSLMSTHYALHQEPGLVLQVRVKFIIPSSASTLSM